MHQEAQAKANRSLNRALVVRNWLLGQRIFEFEQRGADRAKYGKMLTESISQRLKPLGRGFSKRSIEQFHRFYRDLGHLGIAQTVSARLGVSDQAVQIAQMVSAQLPSAGHTESGAPHVKAVPLSWSHYVTLLTIDDADERRFYEIEASKNNWGVRELKRQLADSK
ncbi:DUF1016 N-terminal domain-containing protein [Rhodopirellula sp. MGV]|uniref:DUF1016 N-terminal domain-containing protein n=1 Tax=Rhodopirellula sp. MGV TaxID=2023130 RepID=UPI001E5CEEEE|nr:DUF1016 N-terminal domain-containing protein [Rhodopirellula sp. MGV]